MPHFGAFLWLKYNNKTVDSAFKLLYTTFMSSKKEFKMTVLQSNLPIAELEKVRNQYRAQSVKIRVRYRGPRYDAGRLTCLKKDARGFSVYLK